MFKGFTRLLHSPGEHLKSLLDSPESASDALSPRIIPRSEHPVSRQQISEAALKVLYRLNGAGFDAYLVGGCIRDALLGKMPKDFDVATNATPEQVRDLFRNENQPEQSYSERQLYEAALERMAREVATVNKTTDDEAILSLEAILAKTTGGARRKNDNNEAA